MPIDDIDPNKGLVLQPDAEKARFAEKVDKVMRETPISASRTQQKHQYIASEADKDRFAAILEETGSVVLARKELNWSKSGMMRVRALDPEFDDQCNEAQERWVATINTELHRRAMDGSDKLLELEAKRWMPEFRERFTVDQTGTLQHEHKLAHVVAMRTLTPDQRAAMRVLLEGQKERGKLLPAGEDEVSSGVPELGQADEG